MTNPNPWVRTAKAAGGVAVLTVVAVVLFALSTAGSGIAKLAPGPANPAGAVSTAALPEEVEKCIHVERLSDRTIVVRAGVDYFTAVTALSTERGLVVFDAGSAPSISARFREIIETTFGRSDFAYLINTHAHWDHTNGNRVFQDAVIIAHERAGAEMAEAHANQAVSLSRLRARVESLRRSLSSLEEGSERSRQTRFQIGHLETVLADLERDGTMVTPTLGFSDRALLDLGDVTVELIAFGNAHSRSDILAYVPEERLLMVGDLFNRGGGGNLSRLNHGHVVKADVDRWHGTLAWVLRPERKIDRIVDGHGALLAREDLLVFSRTVDDLWAAFNSGRDSSARARLAEVLDASGLQAMVDEYRSMASSDQARYYFYQGEFIDFGYHLLRDGKVKEAIEIFKINAERNPTSWNAHDSLGEAYLTDGQRALALASYRRSLELNPGNRNAREKMGELE